MNEAQHVLYLLLFCVNLRGLVRIYDLTIRLWARDFYEVIVDEAKGRINYHLIENKSE